MADPRDPREALAATLSERVEDIAMAICRAECDPESDWDFHDDMGCSQAGAVAVVAYLSEALADAVLALLSDRGIDCLAAPSPAAHLPSDQSGTPQDHNIVSWIESHQAGWFKCSCGEDFTTKGFESEDENLEVLFTQHQNEVAYAGASSATTDQAGQGWFISNEEHARISERVRSAEAALHSLLEGLEQVGGFYGPMGVHMNHGFGSSSGADPVVLQKQMQAFFAQHANCEPLYRIKSAEARSVVEGKQQ